MVLEEPTGWHVLELGGTLGNYEVSNAYPCDHSLLCLIVLSPSDSPNWAQVEKAIAKTLSLSACACLVDSPAGSVVDTIKDFFVARNFQVAQDGCLCSELGDAVAQRKVWTLCSQVAKPTDGWLKRYAALQTQSLPMAPYLRNSKEVKADEWLELEDLVIDPRIRPRTACLPKVAAKAGIDGAEVLVYSISGPTPTLSQAHKRKGVNGILLLDPKGAKSGVRALHGLEFWRLHGGKDSMWTEKNRDQLVFQATRSMPVSSARKAAIAAMKEIYATRPEEFKAGICEDPEEATHLEEL